MLTLLLFRLRSRDENHVRARWNLESDLEDFLFAAILPRT
jgi:hypothetical protein